MPLFLAHEILCVLKSGKRDEIVASGALQHAAEDIKRVLRPQNFAACVIGDIKLCAAEICIGGIYYAEIAASGIFAHQIFLCGSRAVIAAQIFTLEKIRKHRLGRSKRKRTAVFKPCVSAKFGVRASIDAVFGAGEIYVFKPCQIARGFGILS